MQKAKTQDMDDATENGMEPMLPANASDPISLIHRYHAATRELCRSLVRRSRKYTLEWDWVGSLAFGEEIRTVYGNSEGRFLLYRPTGEARALHRAAPTGRGCVELRHRDVCWAA